MTIQETNNGYHVKTFTSERHPMWEEYVFTELDELMAAVRKMLTKEVRACS